MVTSGERIVGPNGCTCGFNGDCNCPFIESDVPEAEEAAPAKKRKKSTSPTQRTLAECRKRGLVAQVVEKWNPHARIRQDLFGVIDLLAIMPPSNLGPGSILGIQACVGGDHAKRREKILAEPRAAAWMRSGGRLELWSWSKRGNRGARKLWTLRVEAFTADSWRRES